MPFNRILRCVKNAVNCHYISSVFIKNCIWKTPYQTSTVVFVNGSVHFGCSTNGLDASLDTAEKFFSQSGPFTFIPCIRFGNVLFRLRGDDEFSGHSGCAPSLSTRPRKVPTLRGRLNWPYAEPARLSASRGPELIPDQQPGRPRDPQRVEVSPKGSSQTQKYRLESLLPRTTRQAIRAADEMIISTVAP